MANTVPANLVGRVVSDLFFQSFHDTLFPITGFATDFGGEIPQGNKSISVPVYGGGTVGDFAGDYTANADSTIGEVDVTINKHKIATVHLTDTEAANSKAANIRNMAISKGQALALAVLQDILSVVLNANYPRKVTKSAATFTSDTVTDIKDQCDIGKMPKAGRILLLADGHYNALLKDTSIKNANHYGSEIAIQSGYIPNLVGFRTFQTGVIPANGENLVGMAAVSSAVAVAMRYLMPQAPEAYISTQRIQHPESGIVLGVREFAKPESGKRYLTFECNYGYAVGGEDDALVRLVSA